LSRTYVRAIVPAVALALLVSLNARGAVKRPVTADDLWKMKRVGSLSLSPDGKTAAVVATEYDVAKNEGQGDIWFVRTDGSGASRFTTGATTESSPVWSPCGKKLAFVSKREGDDKPQLYVISLDGGEAARLTEMPLGVSNLRWAGHKIFFVSEVLPGYEGKLDSMKVELERRAKKKITAKTTEVRLFRYWDHWLTEGTVPHLFSIECKSGRGGALTDLTPGWNRLLTDSGDLDYDVSPDAKEIAFSALEFGAPYDSLVNDIFLIDVAKPGAARNVTPENPADDLSPRYTSDGKHILYGMQRIVGFYGDRVRLVRYDRSTGEKKVLTEDWDRSPSGWVDSKDGKTVFFGAEDRSATSLFSIGIDGGAAKQVYRGGTNGSVGVTDDGRLVFFHNELSAPNEVYSVRTNGKSLRKLSSFNDEILAGLEFGTVEDVVYKGFGGADVQMYVVYPPGFDAAKKWPLLILVHGGPHGIFGDEFHFRWNAHAFAAPGYVTALVNFHGSSSFGQDFTDAITGEHGRKPFEDVMKAADLLVGRGFVDGKRMAVAGGSYGGYLVSWIGTQTDRFACLINHAGVFDLCAQFGSDVTFGRERSYGGNPWTSLENVIRWSPAHNMAKYVTPTLIVHGERDYRVPVGNALELYGMLGEKGVPAKLVYFPDENHWVLTPQNSLFWYGEFLDWLERHIGAGPEG